MDVDDALAVVHALDDAREKLADAAEYGGGALARASLMIVAQARQIAALTAEVMAARAVLGAPFPTPDCAQYCAQPDTTWCGCADCQLCDPPCDQVEIPPDTP